MLQIKIISKFDCLSMKKVAFILHACGKDMSEKYNLRHWDNPFIKTFMIVVFCSIKNDVYLVYNDDIPSATFMIKTQGNTLHFEKLATLPSESGKGFGSFCLSKIEEIAKKYCCEKITMEVYESSQHAISFYEHKGYKNVGMIDTVRYREIIMEKSI